MNAMNGTAAAKTPASGAKTPKRKSWNTAMRGFDRHRFRALREAADFSAEALATASGVERAAIHRWESGECRPQPDKLKLVADVLAVTPDKFMAIPPQERTMADLRGAAGLTQNELAKKIGSTRRVVVGIENGGGSLDPSRTAALAAVFNVAPEIIHAAHARSFLASN